MTISMLSPVNWPGKGACMDADRTLFFPPEGEGATARRMRELRARAVCARCPFTGPDGLCVKWALQSRDTHSIAGGLNPGQRTRLRKKQWARNAARTRKDEAA